MNLLLFYNVFVTKISKLSIRYKSKLFSKFLFKCFRSKEIHQDCTVWNMQLMKADISQKSPYLHMYMYQYLSVTGHCCMLPDKYCLPHSMRLYQVMMMLHFLNDVANDAINTKIENYFIMASLKSETMGTLINRIPGSRLLISRLWECMLNRSASLAMSTSLLKAACLVNLI